MLYRMLIPVLLTGSWLVARAEGGETDFPAPPGGFHRPPDPAQMQEMHQKRLQELHDLLHLSTDQEGAWQAFASASAPPPPPPTPPEPGKRLSTPEAMEQQLNHLKQMESHLQGELQAVRTFYAQLTPEQRTIFDLLRPPHGPRLGPGPGRPPH